MDLAGLYADFVVEHGAAAIPLADELDLLDETDFWALLRSAWRQCNAEHCADPESLAAQWWRAVLEELLVELAAKRTVVAVAHFVADSE